LFFFLLSPEELVDRQKRARLWDIYLGTTSPSKDKLHRAETVRIRNIEKQLASMNRQHRRRLTNESIFPDEEDARVNRQISLDETARKRPSTLRRRSSFDELTLERLKAAQQTDRSVIRNYFRRNLKTSLRPIRQESISPPPSSQADDLSLFTDHITNLTRRRSEIELDSEQESPYSTYFYRSNSFTTGFFPVSSSQHSIS